MSASRLFTSGDIGTLALPNRLARSATAERMADADGVPKPGLKGLYRELAQGGVGLIITGHMYVHPSGKAHPEMTGIYADEMVPDLADLADAVHQEGGRAVVQINHGGRVMNPKLAGEKLVGPSAIASPVTQNVPHELTVEEIEEIITQFVQTALNAKRAGAWMVEYTVRTASC